MKQDGDPINVNILKEIPKYPFLTVGECFTIPYKYAREMLERGFMEEAIGSLDIPSNIFGTNTFSRANISLPQNENDIAFVERISEEVQNLNLDLFFEQSSKNIVEITEWHDPQKDRYVFGKSFVDPLRLKALLEEDMTFFIMVKGENKGYEIRYKSPSKELVNYAIKSPLFQDSLPQISGVFESPFLFVRDGKLTVTKPGYNEDCRVYVRKDSPTVEQISVDEAKLILNECLLDFPFESEQDRVFSVASILTPMMRGIYGQYGVRTPIFGYLANQQGCGKDYLAGIRHIIYTGKFNEDGPLSNDKGSNSEETEKQIVGAAQTGQQFMHNSNCRGRLENASYEKHATASSLRGRILSTNVTIDSENIIEFSFSGNYGLTFNKDIARRTIFINLFTDVEDTTKRKFTKNLHQWIKDNRSKILSAIYTLIRTWWDAGHTMGQGVNASYPTWAAFCSGVMTYHNLGDPCASSGMIINDIGGDIETQDISRFNRDIGDWLCDAQNLISEYCTDHDREGLTKKQIFALFEKVYLDNDDRPFAKFDLSVPRDRRELGRVINKYIGTYRGGYKLVISKNSEKQDRIKHRLKKRENDVLTVPTVLAFTSTQHKSSENIILYSGAKVDPLGTVGTNQPNLVEKALVSGELMETQPGVYRKVI